MGVVISGELTLKVAGKEIGNLGKDELLGILPMIIIEKEPIQVFSSSESSLLIQSQAFVDELMFDNEELALAMYRWARDQESRWLIVTKEMVS
jgi:hypothetical protein